jgi:hypothetical protein
MLTTKGKSGSFDRSSDLTNPNHTQGQEAVMSKKNTPWISRRWAFVIIVLAFLLGMIMGRSVNALTTAPAPAPTPKFTPEQLSRFNEGHTVLNRAIGAAEAVAKGDPEMEQLLARFKKQVIVSRFHVMVGGRARYIDARPSNRAGRGAIRFVYLSSAEAMATGMTGDEILAYVSNVNAVFYPDHGSLSPLLLGAGLLHELEHWSRSEHRTGVPSPDELAREEVEVHLKIFGILDQKLGGQLQRGIKAAANRGEYCWRGGAFFIPTPARDRLDDIFPEHLPPHSQRELMMRQVMLSVVLMAKVIPPQQWAMSYTPSLTRVPRCK